MKGDAMEALNKLEDAAIVGAHDPAPVRMAAETVCRALTQEAAPVVPDAQGALNAVTRMVKARGEECICMDLAQDGRRCEFHTAQRIVTGYLLDSLPKANPVPDGERERWRVYRVSEERYRMFVELLNASRALRVDASLEPRRLGRPESGLTGFISVDGEPVLRWMRAVDAMREERP